MYEEKGTAGRPRLSWDRPCTKCGKSYPEVAFRVREHGYKVSQCKECVSKQNREYYARNRNSILEKQRESYARNPIPTRERVKAYRENNKELVKIRNKRYRELNKEHISTYNAAYWLKNKDKHKDRVYKQRAEWGKKNKLREKARYHEYRARKLASQGQWTPQEWEKLKFKYNYTCLCCGRKEPEIKLTFDHVIPVSRGGSNDIQNAQPLCKPCNSRKQNKTTDYRTTAGVAA